MSGQGSDQVHAVAVAADGELARLRRRIPELERQADELARARKLQTALFEISELSHTVANMGRFYDRLHRIVGSLMYAENFLIAVRTPDSHQFRFEYYADSVDQDLTPAQLNTRPQAQLEATLTAYVMRVGRIVHVDREATYRLCDERQIQMIGTPSVDWLAVPLKRADRTVGALVVQSYDEDIVYSKDDELVLDFVGQHVATALERKWAENALREANDALEQRVERRTRELSVANQELEREIQERRRGEKLQAALFRIAQLAGEHSDLETFYRSIHQVISELVYARNIFIAIADEEARVLRFPYYEDESGDLFGDMPIPDDPSTVGPTLRIYFSGEPLLYRHDSDQPPDGYRGTLSYAWLGVPLKTEQKVIGVMAIQSYDQRYTYEERDKALLTFVAQHVGTAIERRVAKQALQKAHDELERRVEERTRELREANRELRSALGRLEETQVQLVEAEKMASLGGLVAGVAHEINTPLGVAVTAASHLQNRCRKLVAAIDNGETATAADVRRVTEEAVELLLSNLQKASRLVASFKQVAADQNTEDRRVFNLGKYLDEIVTSLRPRIRKAGHQIRVTVPEDLQVDGYPFAFYPIVSNLVMNSLTHAFDPGSPGTMWLSVEPDGDHGIRLHYRDNGRGMSAEVRKRIFEPFFTTRRGHGGTGLGMHIAYNHVLKLGGTIHCDSDPGGGVRFDMWFPVRAPGHPTEQQ